MSRPVVSTRCTKCGAAIVILNTKRAKRIAINPEPVGHNAFRYRDWHRNEEYYEYGTHQPHAATCTARAKEKAEPPKPERKRYV